MIYLIAIGAIVALISPFIFYFEWREVKFRKRIKRNDEVAKFRQIVLFKYTHLYDQLPTYDEMLNSNNPLTINFYFPNLKTDNLNETTQNQPTP